MFRSNETINPSNYCRDERNHCNYVGTMYLVHSYQFNNILFIAQNKHDNLVINVDVQHQSPTIQ